MHLGFDRFDYPGDDVLASLKSLATPQLAAIEPSMSSAGGSVTITGSALIAAVPDDVSGDQVIVSGVSRWGVTSPDNLQLAVGDPAQRRSDRSVVGPQASLQPTRNPDPPQLLARYHQ